MNQICTAFVNNVHSYADYFTESRKKSASFALTTLVQLGGTLYFSYKIASKFYYGYKCQTPILSNSIKVIKCDLFLQEVKKLQVDKKNKTVEVASLLKKCDGLLNSIQSDPALDSEVKLLKSESDEFRVYLAKSLAKVDPDQALEQIMLMSDPHKRLSAIEDHFNSYDQKKAHGIFEQLLNSSTPEQDAVDFYLQIAVYLHSIDKSVLRDKAFKMALDYVINHFKSKPLDQITSFCAIEVRYYWMDVQEKKELYLSQAKGIVESDEGKKFPLTYLRLAETYNLIDDRISEKKILDKVIELLQANPLLIDTLAPYVRTYPGNDEKYCDFNMKLYKEIDQRLESIKTDQTIKLSSQIDKLLDISALYKNRNQTFEAEKIVDYAFEQSKTLDPSNDEENYRALQKLRSHLMAKNKEFNHIQNKFISMYETLSFKNPAQASNQYKHIIARDIFFAYKNFCISKNSDIFFQKYMIDILQYLSDKNVFARIDAMTCKQTLQCLNDEQKKAVLNLAEGWLSDLSSDQLPQAIEKLTVAYLRVDNQKCLQMIQSHYLKAAKFYIMAGVSTVALGIFKFLPAPKTPLLLLLILGYAQIGKLILPTLIKKQ